MTTLQTTRPPHRGRPARAPDSAVLRKRVAALLLVVVVTATLWSSDGRGNVGLLRHRLQLLRAGIMAVGERVVVVVVAAGVQPRLQRL